MRGSPLLLAVLLLTASPGGAEPEVPRGTKNPLVGQAFGTIKPLTWMTKDGKPFRFADRPYTLLRWWTNGCPHCAASVPALARLERKYAARGLRLVAVYHPKGRNLRTQRNMRAYLKRLSFTGDVAADPRWVKLRDLRARGRLTGATSVSFLMDAGGVVRWVHPGPRLYRTKDARWAHADRAYRELAAFLSRELPSAHGRIYYMRGPRLWSSTPDGMKATRIDLTHKPDMLPAWGPARRRLAFSTLVAGKRKIVVAEPGGTARTYEAEVDEARVDRVRWSPRGDGLLFQLGFSDIKSSRVFRLDLRTGRVTGTADKGQNDLAACWSPNGRSIAIVTVTGERKEQTSAVTMTHYDAAIDILDVATAKRRRLVPNQRQVFDVSWSPNGRMLACATMHGVHVIGTDGRGGRVVTRASVGEALWSPDSTRLLVAYAPALPKPRDPKGTWDLAILALEGRVLQRWRAVGEVHAATWGPAGRQVAFVRSGELFRVKASGGKPVSIARDVAPKGVSWR